MFIESPSTLAPAAKSNPAEMPVLLRARVLQADAAGLWLQPDDGVANPDQRLKAESALAHWYEPAVGDTVLALGQAGRHYVVGVVKATGPLRMTVPADVEIRAPRGRIALSARHGVDIEADEVGVTANRLTVVAQTLVERVGDATRWVRGACQLRAGRLRLAVEDDYRLKAARISQRADRDVKIDGSSIHLG